MKLILKRIEKTVPIQALCDAEPKHVGIGELGPFALHTEDGQILPCQVSTSMASERSTCELTVVFKLDGDKIKVEGDE
ncbi:hypothetical protein HX824_05760 [Pseudomonas sp. D4002]|uniref:hypothetical protein n=1 Tax=Pseudomonas sp. D4002 TaxID=2738817 RepID=UPI0015A328F1|nr:hypothetical protein [Pseudomonas sp. D4002]NWB20096.1 hypothetical protein [Pseudomonas sp. D4002]